MTELIEKTSYASRLVDLRGIINTAEDPYKALTEYISQQVELAYKAGMLRFNALDHTLKETTFAKRKSWVDANLSHTETGDYVTLPSLYLQAKGFKK